MKKTPMNDKELMNDLLSTVKFNCDLLLNGTVESATPEVRDAFNTCLFEWLKVQDEIARKISARGWYEVSPAEPAKIRQTERKFANQNFS